ncbi:hypothetical protein [Nocardioides humi]|uniref:Peptidase propeptide and YPEB domain-containing protein n=1 Tax=Nocardioides humi TaxID=449461 RepID=A0ABN2A0K6_9ACTN|nr:hypothetical protein [Nocardioides humi]
MSRGWRRYERPGTDEVEREDRDTDGRPLPQEPAAAPVAASGRRTWRWAGPLAAAIVAGGVVFALTRGEDAPPPLPREARYTPIITAEALDAISAALVRETGRDEVLDLWIEDPADMRLTTPPERDGDLADLWRWDGSVLEKWSAEQARDRLPFSLAEIDPTAVVALDEEARDRSDGDISSSRAHIAKPLTDRDHWIYLKVAEVDHGGVVLWADLDGRVESDLINESWRDD